MGPTRLCVSANCSANGNDENANAAALVVRKSRRCMGHGFYHVFEVLSNNNESWNAARTDAHSESLSRAGGAGRRGSGTHQPRRGDSLAHVRLTEFVADQNASVAGLRATGSPIGVRRRGRELERRQN